MRKVASQFIEQLAGDYHWLIDRLAGGLVNLRGVDNLIIHHEVCSSD